MSDRSRSMMAYGLSEPEPDEGSRVPPLAIVAGMVVLLGLAAIVGASYSGDLAASRHTAEEAKQYQQTAVRLHALTGQVVNGEPNAELRREMLDARAEYDRLHQQLEEKRSQGPRLALALRVAGGLLLAAGAALFSRSLR